LGGRRKRTLSGMKRFALCCCAVTLGVGAVVAAPASANSTPKYDQPFAPDVVLVKFRDGTSSSARNSAVDSIGGRVEHTVAKGTRVVRVRKGTVAQAIAKLTRRGDVAYAEPDFEVKAVDTTPNDQLESLEWGLAKINAPAAWDTTTGNPATVVGVLDTGIDYNHVDLAANVWNNPGVAGCPAGTHGFNFAQPTTPCAPLDDNGHGSHVSGTIGAVGNNGIGVVGVNWNVSLMGLKVLGSSGSGSITAVAQGVQKAIEAKQAGVNIRAINASIEGGASQTMRDAIDLAGQNGITFVAAAGNDAHDNDATPTYPCNYHLPNEICVAATDRSDALASFSNWGAGSVDIEAPGVGVVSTYKDNNYASLDGTSMATPHVTGAVALLESTPGCENATPETIKAWLLGTVDATTSLVTSHGRLDIGRAVADHCAGTPPTPPDPPPPRPPPPHWTSFTSFGAATVDAPAAISTDTGKIDVFWHDAAGTLYAQHFDGTNWVANGSLPLFALTTPYAIQTTPHQIDVFAANGKTVSHAWYVDGVFAGREIVHMHLDVGRAVVATTDCAGRIDLFGGGKNGLLRHMYRLAGTTRWKAKNQSRANVDTDPTAVVTGPDSIAVFAVGADNVLRQHTFIPSLKAWSKDVVTLGSSFDPVDIITLQPEPGVIEMYAVRQGRIVHSHYELGTWSDFFDVAGGGTGMAITSNLVRTDLYVRRGDGSLWHIPLSGGAQTEGAQQIGSHIVGSPAATAWNGDRLDVFVAGESAPPQMIHSTLTLDN